REVHRLTSTLKGFAMSSSIAKWLRPFVLALFFIVPCALVAGPQDVKDKKDKEAAATKDKKDSGKDSDTPAGLDVPQKELNEEFIALLKVWLDIYTDVLKNRAKGTSDARDNAYAALNLVTLGIMCPLGITLPFACTLMGAAGGATIGAVVTGA